MVLKNQIRKINFIFILFLIVPLSASASGEKDYRISPEIIEAYYADLDADGRQDDVRITIKIKIKGFKDKTFKDGIIYNVILGLVLPDKTESWYLLTATTNTANLKLEFDLLNHATVSGWYEAHSYAYFENYEQKEIYGHSVIFDPPGGQDGGDPKATVSITGY